MTTTDLTTQTPVEIDTALAEIYQRLYVAQDKVAQTEKYLQDYEQGNEKRAAGDLRYSSYTQERVDEYQEKVIEAQVEADKIWRETLPYEAEYRRRPWTRFFHVTNSNGHIHSSMSCSTCFPTTRYAWLTEMSGQSEEQALESLGKAGHVLCSVCFPNAPSEYFVKRQDPNACSGSGQYYDSSLPHRSGYAYGNWATCPECGGKPALTKSFRLRKHKPGEGA